MMCGLYEKSDDKESSKGRTDCIRFWLTGAMWLDSFSHTRSYSWTWIWTWYASK